MKKRSYKQELLIILCCFVVSRVISKLLGVSFGYSAIYEYWQYLDINSLSGNLLQSLWYQHSQPPVFNLLLGIVLKCSGTKAAIALEFLLLLFSICNGALLLGILRNMLQHPNLPLLLSLLYLMSPATILYENELFYTTFLSMLMLITVYFILKFFQVGRWQNAMGIFTALGVICLTKSMYHLLWLLLISGILLQITFKKQGFNKIVLCAFLSVMLVGGWYIKNYILFDSFSASSWVGINFSRIVFQNVEVKDSNNIASVHPFYPLSYYKKYISEDYKKKYAGINDQVLLSETKNNRFINMNNTGYLEVSDRYKDASIKQVIQHPLHYFKNAGTAFIIFFTPASSYFKLAGNNNRIWMYDLVYSFNPSHFFSGEQQKKQALVLAAIPKFLIYGITFLILLKRGFKNNSFCVTNLFICSTLLFSLAVSSLLEYGENMRFRYELEPLFLILLGQAIGYRKAKESLVLE